DARDTSEQYEHRLPVLDPPGEDEADHEDRRGWPVVHRRTGEDNGRSRDRTGGGSCGAPHEGSHLWVPLMSNEPPTREDDAQIDRREDRDRGDGGSCEPSDEVADERGRDDDRPGRDQAHRYGVEELAFGQPVRL